MLGLAKTQLGCLNPSPLVTADSRQGTVCPALLGPARLLTSLLLKRLIKKPVLET